MCSGTYTPTEDELHLSQVGGGSCCVWGVGATNRPVQHRLPLRIVLGSAGSPLLVSSQTGLDALNVVPGPICAASSLSADARRLPGTAYPQALVWHRGPHCGRSSVATTLPPTPVVPLGDDVLHRHVGSGTGQCSNHRRAGWPPTGPQHRRCLLPLPPLATPFRPYYPSHVQHPFHPYYPLHPKDAPHPLPLLTLSIPPLRWIAGPQTSSSWPPGRAVGFTVGHAGHAALARQMQARSSPPPRPSAPFPSRPNAQRLTPPGNRPAGAAFCHSGSWQTPHVMRMCTS